MPCASMWGRHRGVSRCSGASRCFVASMRSWVLRAGSARSSSTWRNASMTLSSCRGAIMPWGCMPSLRATSVLPVPTWKQGYASAMPHRLPPLFHGVYEQRVSALCFLAQVLWELGSADQAQQRIQEALAVAQEGESLFTLAIAQVFAAVLCQWRRDAVATRTYAEA